jgi:hypothetical protein
MTKTIYSILAGLLAYAIIGKLGLHLLKIYWSNYALREIDKSYTLTMLLSRQVVGIAASVIAGVTSTKLSSNNKRSAWLVGVIIFGLAAYHHLFNVWNDYPVWYHLAYLLPIVPVVGLSQYLVGKNK